MAVTGVHAILYSERAEALRGFFRDVLELPFVDAGGGWPIFALPPTELAAHPTEGGSRHELYLMCDDIEATVGELELRGVELARPVTEERFGRLTAIRLPDGSELGLYQPSHPLPPRP